jgi:tetraacyldisaccharide 4'-kinase
MLKTPGFWYRPPCFQAWMLAPFSLIYLALQQLDCLLWRRQKVSVPVICLGNLTVGGTGKTPCTIALGNFLKAQGWNPHVIMRGYGGTHPGPLQVDKALHEAAEVGDEALLMARELPTWIGKNRFCAAQEAIIQGANLILMDDGLHNRTLAYDWGLIVMDHHYGFGNGFVLPAGPLRESVTRGLRRATLRLCVRHQNTPEGDCTKDLHPPVVPVIIVPNPDDIASLRGKAVVAFAGLGHPDKFFTLLQKEGITLQETQAFPDHYPYQERDLERLQNAVPKATLVTTEKDWMRLSSVWQQRVKVVRIQARLAHNHPDFQAFLQQLKEVSRAV